MKIGTQVLQLSAACIVLVFELAMRMGWYSSGVGPIMPLWLRIMLPCLLLFPIEPRTAAYWLDRIPWAVAIGLFLNRDSLPGELGIARLVLWSYLAVRAALVLRNRKHTQAHA